jgi:D-glycero-alpha-D-manno-heptose-7-phosphate kinase
VILTRAPLRIALGGGGTDLPSYYSNHGGFVLSAAINKYVYVCVNRPSSDDLIRVKYSRSEEVEDVTAIQHDLVRAALEVLGITSNIEIASMADVSAGTGLGSSSSYLVALLAALHELKRERLGRESLAELAVEIEMNLAGHPVGKQDQYLASLGGLTCLEIDRNGEVRDEPLLVSLATREELSSRVLLFFTGISRTADEILQQQQEDSNNGNGTVLDSLHVTKEIGLRVKQALEQGDLDEFGRLLHEHWENKKRRSSRISEGKVDRWYEEARDAGALGGKLVGAGGGGFLMLYCPNGSKPGVREALSTEGLRELPYAFDFDGAKVLVSF